MKKALYISFLNLLAIAGCNKDAEIPTAVAGERLPFENSNIKLELVTSSAPSSMRDIYFFNASIGLAITYDGGIYKTTDNGATWTLKYSNSTPNQPFYQIYFTNANVGYVVGGSTSCSGTGCIPPGGVILKSTDAGNNWIIVLQDPSVEFISISANSIGDLFAISNGTKGRISKSINDGITWTTIDSTTFHLGKITFNNNFGFCTGMEGKILKSSDDGTTWTVATTLISLYATDLKFNGDNGFCITDNQRVYKTTDNGNNWTQKLDSEFSSYILNPLTTSSCLVFGAGQYTGGDFGTWYGAVRQTKNAGDEWTETQFNDIEPIRYTSFYSATKGYAASGTKLIEVTVK
ncbi:MAG: hypothetical protein IPL46_00470 [Saprospiraceae bacterium]|nr:hypothetical protein [Saprospiraceae bacterium]